MYPLSYLLGLNRFIHGAWYEPSRQIDIDDCLGLLQLQRTDLAVDIGSGDGRVVLAMAKTGAHVVGIESDKKLVSVSRKNIVAADIQDRVSITHADMWEVDYSRYNKVFVYQFKNAMQQLEEKLLRELKPGSMVVCNYWPFPTWKPVKRKGYAYLYKMEN